MVPRALLHKAYIARTPAQVEDDNKRSRPPVPAPQKPSDQVIVLREHIPWEASWDIWQGTLPLFLPTDPENPGERSYAEFLTAVLCFEQKDTRAGVLEKGEVKSYREVVSDWTLDA